MPSKGPRPEPSRRNPCRLRRCLMNAKREIAPLPLACLIALAGWQTPAAGQAPEASGARTALVVGNGAYTGELPALRNPVNDARLMARTLRALGFQVTLVENAHEDDLESAVVAFGDALRGRGQGGVGLFYYAGHGVQWQGANYLIPVGAEVESERHLRTRTVSAELILDEMGDAPTALNIVVLDACRNNPWAASGKRSIGGSRGLTRMNVPTGATSSFFLAYSAAARQAAEDGDGDNSMYTRALATAMSTPGMELDDVFKEAGRQVTAATASRQVPWMEGSWYGKFFFASPASRPAAKPAAPALAGDAPDPATEAWLQIRETANVQLLERYLADYPSSGYRMAAEARLDALRGQPFRVVVEPSAARVRILNIGPPYQAGMKLPAGEYRVEASAPGHERKVETVAHGGTPTVHRMALRKAGLEAGERFRDCPECPEMVVVPAGSFLMGSPSHERGREDNEGLVHQVTIEVPFAVGVYEVTVAEFGRFVDATGHSTGNACYVWTGEKWEQRNGFGWRNPGFRQGGSHPAVCVSWEDAQAYVAWLSRVAGERYRLPSEAEWEYAARAGTRTARWWGEEEPRQCTHANGADASAGWGWGVGCSDGHSRTAPVGSFRMNAWGLHDVLGNVWEWTQDCWNSNYQGAPSNGRAWERGNCSNRVLRGGARVLRPWLLRSALRSRGTTGLRGSDGGFRVARTLTP